MCGPVQNEGVCRLYKVPRNSLCSSAAAVAASVAAAVEVALMAAIGAAAAAYPGKQQRPGGHC